MKPRHAAALALVGWYLMMPPITYENDVAKLERTAPLSQWIHIGHRIFQSKRDCEIRRKEDDAETRKNPNSPVNPDRPFETLPNMVCISTDDPRLKGN